MRFDGFKPCFALDCETTISRAYLMCKPHWSLVPEAIQSEVYRGCHTWRANGALRPYMLATLRARLAVAEQEKRPDQAARIEIIRADIQRREQLETQS